MTKALFIACALAVVLYTASAVPNFPYLRGNEATHAMKNSNLTYYSVVFSAHSHFEIVEGIHTLCAAYGAFDDTIGQEGWGRLYIHACPNRKERDENLVRAAGVLEAYLTHTRMYQGMRNLKDHLFGKGGEPPANLTMWLREQQLFTAGLIEEAYATGDVTPYIRSLSLFTSQLAGVIEGVVQFALKGEEMTADDVLLINAAGDLYDIIPALKEKSQRPKMFEMSRSELRDHFHRSTSCSAFIRGSPNSSEEKNAYAGHTTWTDFGSMLRVFKFYNYSGLAIASKRDVFPNSRIMFSAKPGVLFSKDDFYVLNDDMVVIETTNGVMNDTLWELVTPLSLLCYQRVMVSNMVAHNGSEWTYYFGLYNSGTYNNQWMVVDMNRVDEQSGEIQDDFLWISEQMPGLYVRGDQTSTYRSQNYTWWSYNVPFYKNVYDYAGYTAAYKKFGDEYSYEKCPRAQIFRRNASSIHTMEDMQHILQYNNWQVDPLSLDDPVDAISARGDLSPKNPSPFGGVDCKVVDYTSMKVAKKTTVQARSGPTCDQQPVFTWKDPKWQNYTHLGQPETFDFPYVEMQWEA